MLKKKINYEDFNGDQRTETLHFHLSKAELLRFNEKHPGGLRATLTRIEDDPENSGLLGFFEDYIMSSYGEKTGDGRHFKKSPEIYANFKDSAAYNALFDWLLESPDNATAFFLGVVPNRLRPEVEKEMARREQLTSGS